LPAELVCVFLEEVLTAHEAKPDHSRSNIACHHKFYFAVTDAVAVVPALVFNLFYFHFAVGSRHGEHTKEQYKDPLWHKRSVPAKLAEVKATNPRLIHEQAEFFGEANAKSTITTPHRDIGIRGDVRLFMNKGRYIRSRTGVCAMYPLGACKGESAWL
jgi:hypothetical protein